MATLKASTLKVKAEKPVKAVKTKSTLKVVKPDEPVEASPIAPIAFVPIVSVMYGKVEYATSMNLKRRIVKDAYYGKLFIPKEHYTDLNAIGINHGCTWDEVVRGMVEMLMRDIPTYERLKDYLPINFNVPSL